MIDFKNKNVMVLAPHQDDEVIGCGGSLLKNKQNIRELVVIHFSKSDIRDKEFTYVAQQLDVTHHVNVNLNDGYFLEDLTKVISKLTKLIQLYRPDIIFLPHKHDNHHDHKAVYFVAESAIRNARTKFFASHFVENCYGYEIWSLINHVADYVEITDVLELKISIMDIYKSQRVFPYDKMIKSLNGYRGVTTMKGDYVECFSRIMI